jgi:N-acetylglucosamine-6-phosphate deacetylase
MTGSGFVDLQVNGFLGLNFSSPDLTLAQVKTTAQALYRQGTVACLPTVVTAPWSVYEHVLPVLAQAIDTVGGGESVGRESKLSGIHLEGPYISPLEGARGVHPLAHIRPPSWTEFKTLFDLSCGHIRLLTLAPELPGALDLIRYAVELGVLVSIGHTLADGPAVQAAVEAGARFSTHLGNGCPAQIDRHNNPLWPQLARCALNAGLITDGHHLPADFVRTVLKVKGAAGTVVTSDLAPAGGLPPGDYEYFGVKSRLEANGRLHSPQTGTLAGSASTMLQCMNWLASLEILDEASLWAVGRDNPLHLLGESGGSDLQGPVRYHAGRFSLKPHDLLPSN